MTPNTTPKPVITVEAAQLHGLTVTGPGHALVWDRQDVFIAPAAMADHGTLLEITTYEEAAAALDAVLATEPGRSLTTAFDRVAEGVTETARTRVKEWRSIELRMSVSGPYSAALRPYGIHRDQLSDLDLSNGDATTRYRLPSGATATVAMPYFHDSLSSITVTLSDANPDATTPAYVATVPRRTPPAAVAALIVTAAGLTPHTTRVYPTRNATGFRDAPKTHTITPDHVRALAAHGPGWTIMWNDDHTHPVIARPTRGDDGRLMEVCTFERMFGLGGDCDTCGDDHTCPACMPLGQPDFEVIAAHMTDILGDYHQTIDDIADYMPSTLPYTRALAEHGFHRRAQGYLYQGNANDPGDDSPSHEVFGQDYRSPDGHLVALHIPVDPHPATAPEPPLTIRWTYLGRTAPGDTYPTTDLPVETPPADVAELIRAHLLFHPPAPAAPDRTTDRTDATGAMGGTDRADRADAAATGTTA
ncbi:hypothetical protein [Nonomuraea soli]|uniref:Uncharacterized protein n=1 Tax=Nonomuraea soli TaxID=1032476 RepID=A0A7W0CUW4_9ACTN|nr:hypothetical protein [Nonomuraea soli]MBA2897672.1 hypothetical protein [Nonomuraea soli]